MISILEVRDQVMILMSETAHQVMILNLEEKHRLLLLISEARQEWNDNAQKRCRNEMVSISEEKPTMMYFGGEIYDDVFRRRRGLRRC